MQCVLCNTQIDPIRLEILPDTTVCKECAKTRAPRPPTISRPPALDPTPYIEAVIPAANTNKRSFLIKKKKPKRGDKRKVPVVFTGTSTTYTYSIDTFERTFHVSRKNIVTALNAKYTFYVKDGILYLDRKGKFPDVRMGKFHRKKST